ncbi:MAG: response regulator [Woeseia sp.]
MQEYSNIRVLIADDDEHILKCYRSAFEKRSAAASEQLIAAMEDELFESAKDATTSPMFELATCEQGEGAVKRAAEAVTEGKPFDVVILDVRMPPGIDGVEAASEIRKLDPDIKIIFVTGYLDIARDEIEQRVPPPSKLYYYSKPLSFKALAADVARIARGDP